MDKLNTRSNIREMAKERGMSMSFIANKLGIYCSNMSSIASAKRGVSLRVLRQMADLLGCSLDELVKGERKPTVFQDKGSNEQLMEIQDKNFNGINKKWVNYVMLAHLNHYRASKRKSNEEG